MNPGLKRKLGEKSVVVECWVASRRLAGSSALHYVTRVRTALHINLVQPDDPARYLTRRSLPITQTIKTLHGVQNEFTFWERMRGKSSDHISFEIASIGRVIKFYVALW